ncbi:hypothetical protein JB92DRAFT_3102173 [Gautieria morchelliformis]|nr:hypothetical protein JB92DRAFT_3102173 [Gautieria morchelliformis]
MYFHYPTWLGSMPDPSMIPPPPVVFKAYYFKPEKSAKSKSDPHVGSYAEDDIGVDYGPEYVRPMPCPPPPNLPKKGDYHEYWTYTRAYHAHPHPFASAHDIPPFPRARPFGYPPTSHEYWYTHSYSYSHPHSQSHAPHFKHPHTSWSTPEATRAWRAKQWKLWEEWDRKAKEARQSRDRSGWDWAPPSSNPRPSESHGGWREGWFPPRSPSPARSDSGGYDRAKCSSGQSHERSWDEANQGREEYRPHPSAERSHFYSNPPSGARLSEAFALYSKLWETLLNPNHCKQLMFCNIPWPQYPSPLSVEDIDVQNVRAFLLAGGRPLKVCLREALLRFHPDKIAMLLQHVVEKDKADVVAGCEAVTRCLSQLMKRTTL